MRLKILIAVLVLAAAGVAWWAARGRAPDRPAEPGPRAGGVREAVPRGSKPPSEVREFGSAAPWIGALAGDDEAKAAEALERLLERFRARELTPEEMLRIGLLPESQGPRERFRDRVLARLHGLGRAGLPLLPQLFDVMETGTEHEREVAANVTTAVASGEGFGIGMTLLVGPDETTDEERRLIVAQLPRIRALLTSEETDFDVRFAMAPLAASLGSRAADLAPALVEWIRAVERGREEFRRTNPLMHVSYVHFELDLARALGALGPDALPSILAALREEDTYGAYEMQLALKQMGRDALPQLTALLADPDPEIRATALEAVAGLREGEPEALAILRAALGDESPEVREAAVERLEEYGADAAEDLLRALSDPDDDVRAAAASGLRATPEAARRAIPRLMEMLRSGTYGEKLYVMSTLAGLGPMAIEAVPLVLDVLAEHLPSQSEERDQRLTRALKPFGPAVVPRLVRIAAEEAGPRRELAVLALLALEDVDPAELRPLAGLLPRQSGQARMQLAAVLARRRDASAASVLLEGLRAEDRGVRIAAAEGLQRAGPEAVPALPRLVEGLRENDARLRAEGAAWGEEWPGFYAYWLALQHVGAHVPAKMIPLLGDVNEEVREAASKALRHAGDAGVAAANAAWDDLSPEKRVLVVVGLAPLVTAPNALASARARIAAALEDDDPRVRLAAAKALVKETAFRTRAVEVWIELVSIEDGEIAGDAAWRLRSQGKFLARHEAALRKALETAHRSARTYVQDAIDAIEDAR